MIIANRLTRSQNLVQGELVNGSVGQVIGFSTSQEALTNRTEIAEVDESRAPVHGSLTAQNPGTKNDRVWPVVRFTNGKTVLIVPAKFTVNNADGRLEASREQVSRALSLVVEYRRYHKFITLIGATHPGVGPEHP